MNALLFLVSIALVTVQTWLASHISVKRGGLINVEGLFVVATIALFSFYMGYFGFLTLQGLL